ncbi:Aldo/keto reductase [Amylocystis lapponica]|nr:Aldo/keto reductase [Amylocystis lapponica]
MSLTVSSTVRLLSGNSVPLLGLGMAKNEDCVPVVVAALKHGYRLIDCARHYENEAGVGQGVRASGIPRSDIFVTSKIMAKEHGYESTLNAVDESLGRFGFDHLDLFLIHSPLSGKELRLATWRALLDAKKAGKLRDIGVSNYGVKHLEEIREAGLETPAVNQLEVHPFCQQRQITEYCTKHGIVVQAFCPLIRGAHDNPILQDISKKNQKSVAQVLIRWSLQRGFSPLPKSSQPARVIENAELYDFELVAEDMARIDALDCGEAGAISWNPINAP